VVIYCRTYWKRLMGLMFKKTIDQATYYYFPKCHSIHTCFMRFEIEALALDVNNRVIAKERLSPWSIKRFPKGTVSIVESKGSSFLVGEMFEVENEK